MNRSRDEHGFTLVELLIAVAILGIIMASLGGALSVGYRTMDDTSNRFAGSTDAQLLTVHFPSDVQSATKAKTSEFDCVGAENPIIELTDGAWKVVYGMRKVDGEFQLVRYDECTNDPADPSSVTVIARHLPGEESVAAELDPGETFTGAALHVTERATSSDSTPYRFTVEGRRRAT